MKISQKELSELRKVRDLLMMENFHPSADDRIGSSEEVRLFIQEKTHLWRRTWILGPLNKLIESANKPKKQR